MRIVNIDIAVSNGLLNSTVKSLPKEYSQYTLGTQHDHEAQKFVFTRPEEYAEYDLILHFESGKQPYTVHLGDANEYVIPNALTQSKELRFQVSFARGDEYLESDAPTMFFLRPKLKDGGEPEPIPSPIDELFDLAVAKFEVDEERNLLGINNAGRTVSSVYLPGGGGGSDDIWKPDVSADGDISFARSTSITPPEPRNIMGPQGIPGVSPTATVHKEGDTATITITDVNGTTTTVISDGEKGDDGDSPSATVTQTATGARIEITDKDGATITDVSNGADGVSPSVDVVEISGGHIVTITDADGTESFQVMDGGKGDPGQAATIAIGTVTTGEPGTDAAVENVGTDTAAVLEFTIPRGADGSGGNFPWVLGRTENRSLVANETGYTTPVYVDGDPTMLMDTRLVIPEDGVYILQVGRGQLTTTPTVLRHGIVHTRAGVSSIIAQAAASGGVNITSTNAIWPMKKGDYLTRFINSSTASSSIVSAPGDALMDFYLARIL